MHRREAVARALREKNLGYHCLETAEGAWAIVVPGLGAKVLAAGVDSENCWWTNKELAKGAWCVGGQRTWLAPELGKEGFFGNGVQDWKVPPELDPGNYRRIESSTEELAFQNDLCIERPDGLPLSLRMVRSLRLETVNEVDGRKGIRIRINNRLINRMERIIEGEVGLWNILQAPADTPGTFLIPLNQARAGYSTEQSYNLYFGDLPADWITQTPTLLYLKAHAGKWYKIGIPADFATGTLALLRPSRVDDRSVLMILRCQVDRAGCYIDKPSFMKVENGDALQCYNSPDTESMDFCELETHAPAVRLAPGSRQSAQVEILLFKDQSERLAELTKCLVSPEFHIHRLFAQ